MSEDANLAKVKEVGVGQFEHLMNVQFFVSDVDNAVDGVLAVLVEGVDHVVAGFEGVVLKLHLVAAFVAYRVLGID